MWWSKKQKIIELNEIEIKEKERLEVLAYEKLKNRKVDYDIINSLAEEKDRLKIGK